MVFEVMRDTLEIGHSIPIRVSETSVWIRSLYSTEFLYENSSRQPPTLQVLLLP